MSIVVEKVIPVILIFFAGFALKKTNVLTIKDADTLLKVFFNFSLPPLIMLSVFQMAFSFQLLLLPVIAVLVIFITYVIAHHYARFLNLDKPSLGVFLVGSLIMNGSFSFPFLLATGGADSLAQASLFDLGNSVLVFTFIYYLACKYGTNSSSLFVMIGKFIRSPPLLALILGLFLNLVHFPLPLIVTEFCKIVGYMTVPLVMLTLGIYFRPQTSNMLPALSAVFIRMAVGLLLGLAFVHLFDLKGVTKTVVLVCSSAPSGLNVLVFSSMEELDNELAASIVSYSVAIGIFLIPLLIQLTSD